jgi:hypothetical protein
VYKASQKLVLDAYVDTYYTLTNDSLPRRTSQQFGTVSAFPNQFGLNLAQLGLSYTSDRLRGRAAVFLGDIPYFNANSDFPYLREASLGFRFAENIWFNAGFGPTVIGAESLIPQSNIAGTVALVSDYTPWFQSYAGISYETQAFKARIAGVNLTLPSTDPFAFRNTGVALSLGYEPLDGLELGFGSMTTGAKLDVWNQVPADDADTVSIRSYNTLHATYRQGRFTGIAQLSLAYQSGLYTEMTANGRLALRDGIRYGGFLAAKYHFGSKEQFGAYGRVEYYVDDKALETPQYFTGRVDNNGNPEFSGLRAVVFTLGAECRPVKNAYVRLEGRLLNAFDDQRWFNAPNSSLDRSSRLDLIFTAGVYFKSGNIIRVPKPHSPHRHDHHEHRSEPPMQD